MSSWSQRRRFTYIFGIVIIAVVIIGIPVFFSVYKPPSCSDGVKNGDEQGVDCGGSCQHLCQSAFLSPNISWTRFEQVAPGLYNVAAYLINPNIEGEAQNVPYHIALYDDQGMMITDVVGKITLPPHRNALAFQGSVSTSRRVPTKALFEFTQNPNWHKSKDSLSGIQIFDKQYTEDESGGSLLVTLKNTTADTIGTIDVGVVLYDKDSNAIGFSKTVVDEILGFGQTIAPFTWPTSRQGSVISIEVLPVSE